MAKKRRRKRRATLKGWWRGLPLILLGFGLYFSFTWLETQRLRNEYRANELTREIRRVKVDIEKLHVQRQHLNRMDRLDEKAPELNLKVARPDQKVVIQVTPEDLAAVRNTNPQSTVASRAPARSVIFTLGPPHESSRAPTSLLHTLAQRIMGNSPVEDQEQL